MQNRINNSVLNLLDKYRNQQNYIEVHKVKDCKWVPAPRECATLTVCDFKMYMIGGINYDACKDIIEGRIYGDSVIWERIPYKCNE